MGLIESIVFQPPQPPSSLQSGSSSNNLTVHVIPSAESRIPVAIIKDCTVVGVVLFFSHGNAEDLGQLIPFLVRVHAKLKTVIPDCAVCSYDYCGYGAHAAASSPSEAKVYANAHDALAFCKRECGLARNDRVVVWGRSLGSGPTCELAFRASRAEDVFLGVILQSPLLSVFRVALRSTNQTSIPFDMFRNYEKCIDTNCFAPSQVFVIHGKNDSVVPCSHGETISNLIQRKHAQPYPALFVENAGHNDIDYILHLQQSKSVEDVVSSFVLHTQRQRQRQLQQT